MRRFRRRRRRRDGMRKRALGLALLPIAVVFTTTSLTSAATSDRATLTVSKRVVEIGSRVRLSGDFPGTSQARVIVLRRRAGAKHFQPVAETRTGTQGHFSVRVKPAASGRWRARLARPDKYSHAGSTGVLGDQGTAGTGTVDPGTDRERVRVRSRVRVRVSKRHPIVGQAVRIHGLVKPRGRRHVTIRVGDTRLKTSAGRDGRFARRWTPSSTGKRKVRVVARGNRVATGSRDRGGRVTVFRPAQASYYGPGFYGGTTACGQTLQPSTLGVAHKTLPCGTRVTLRYGSRQVTVPVIDRGPYVAGREYDLTEATKNRLGFPSTGTVLSSR